MKKMVKSNCRSLTCSHLKIGLTGLIPKELHKNKVSTLGEVCSFIQHQKNWAAEFKHGMEEEIVGADDPKMANSFDFECLIFNFWEPRTGKI